MAVAVAEEVETGTGEVEAEAEAAGTIVVRAAEEQTQSEEGNPSAAVAAGVLGSPAAGHIQEIPSVGLVERERRSRWAGDRRERAAVAAAVEIAEKMKVAVQNQRVLGGRCSLPREKHWIGNTWQKRRAMQEGLD